MTDLEIPELRYLTQRDYNLLQSSFLSFVVQIQRRLGKTSLTRLPPGYGPRAKMTYVDWNRDFYLENNHGLFTLWLLHEFRSGEQQNGNDKILLAAFTFDPARSRTTDVGQDIGDMTKLRALLADEQALTTLFNRLVIAIDTNLAAMQQ